MLKEKNFIKHQKTSYLSHCLVALLSHVLDDSLTNLRLTTRTEQLTKCCEPLQKLRVRLGACKTGLSPPVILYYWSFQGDTSVAVLIVLCFGVEFLCCLSIMCVFIFLVKFG